MGLKVSIGKDRCKHPSTECLWEAGTTDSFVLEICEDCYKKILNINLIEKLKEKQGEETMKEIKTGFEVTQEVLNQDAEERQPDMTIYQSFGDRKTGGRAQLETYGFTISSEAQTKIKAILADEYEDFIRQEEK